MINTVISYQLYQLKQINVVVCSKPVRYELSPWSSSPMSYLQVSRQSIEPGHLIEICISLGNPNKICIFLHLIKEAERLIFVSFTSFPQARIPFYEIAHFIFLIHSVQRQRCLNNDNNELQIKFRLQKSPFEILHEDFYVHQRSSETDLSKGHRFIFSLLNEALKICQESC